MDFQQPDYESEEAEIVPDDITVDTPSCTLPSFSRTDKALTNAGEKTIQADNTRAVIGEEGGNGGRQYQTVHLDDLMNMIRDAEKNILLLNQARIRALEDLDKIVSEKETLKAEMNLLEIKLAETDAQMKDATQAKVEVKILENQLEKLKNEITSGNLTAQGNITEYQSTSYIQDPEIVLHNGNALPVDKELNSLRKENMLLKQDIQTLKAKLSDVQQSEERVIMLEEEKSLLEAAIKELEGRLTPAQEDVSKLTIMESEYRTLHEKVENLEALLNNAEEPRNQSIGVLEQNFELQRTVDKLETSLEEETASNVSSNAEQRIQQLQGKDKAFQMSDQEVSSNIQLHQESVNRFPNTLKKLEEAKRKTLGEPAGDLPWEFWTRLLLTIDGWMFEGKIFSNDAKLLREMAWKRDGQIRDTFLACSGINEQEALEMFLRLISSATRPGLNIVHIAAEMAPVAKVGGLADVVTGLSKALQRKGHLVEIILPKYDCMNYEHIADLKALDVDVQSHFDGQLFKNKIWVGSVEGLPVYFVEPHHPAKFFWRGQYYGEHDDFKRFSFFSRAALEFLNHVGKRPDIIHCHDWQTSFVAPLYWDIYALKGFNSARVCFTCHNFEHQGRKAASELSSCELNVRRLLRSDRMQDNYAHDRVNAVKGAVVFSNVVTTVSPTYACEVRTPEGGHGLHETLNAYAKKFVGILNGIDTDTWDPSTDAFLRFQYNADDLQGKAENKDAIRKELKLSSSNPYQPLVGCITRLVPQKGVHLIRHAIYRTLELGGQFLLLGSSPVPHIQREFEDIANHFQSHPHVRLLLKYDEALSHSIYAASDMFIVPSIFEPCGLTQMIAMRYGSVPIVRKTGGLNDSVFDVDDDTIPMEYRNGFTFFMPDEEGLNGAMNRAFDYYKNKPEIWQQLVQKDMRIDFSWDFSAPQYEELYKRAALKTKAAASHT